MPSDIPDDDFSRRADELFAQLSDDTDRLVDPLPAHRVRQLGDRRRTRRRVGAAAGALAVAAIAATTALNLSTVDSPRRADPAAPATQPAPAHPSIATSAPAQVPVVTVTATVTPTITDEPSATGGATGTPDPTGSGTPATAPSGSTAAAPAPSASASSPLGLDDLPTKDDLARGGSTDMYTSQTVEPDGDNPQYAVSPCEQGRTSLGHTVMLHRVLSGKDITTHVVAWQFATPEKATEARGVVRAWYASCTAQMTGNGWTGVKLTPAVDTPIGSNAQRFQPTQATFRLVSGTSADKVPTFEEASILQVGDRLEWIVTTLTGAQDDSFDTAPGGPVGVLYPGIEHSARITNMLAPGN